MNAFFLGGTTGRALPCAQHSRACQRRALLPARHTFRVKPWLTAPVAWTFPQTDPEPKVRYKICLPRLYPVFKVNLQYDSIVQLPCVTSSSKQQQHHHTLIIEASDKPADA